MQTIENLKKTLGWIDTQILETIKKRIEITNQIGTLKIKTWEPMFVPEQERKMLDSLSKRFDADIFWIESMWREIMYISKREQQKLKQTNKNTITIWIQWGKGSFNDIAIANFLDKNSFDKEVKIEYLYTTEAVLESLNSGAIDYGQFALANSIGGIVEETITGLGAYRWTQVENYHIPVKHSLLLHPNASIDSIDTIMGHEQAIQQCKTNLTKMYPHCKKIGGTDLLTDNASIAEAVANGTLPKTTAAIGHESLASLYNLKIHKKNIQDQNDNQTTFVLVKL